MSYTFSTFSLPLLLNAAICAFFSYYGWRHRVQFRWGIPFSRLMATIGGWSLAYGLEILGADVATKNLWETFIIVCIALSAAFYLILAIEYAGREHWLTPYNTFLICLPALLTVVLALSNDFHHLVWIEIRLDASGPFLAALPVRGPWFWVHAGLTWLYMVAGLVFYGQSLMRAPHTYRMQGIIMIVGGLLPVIGNLLHIAGIVQAPGLDLGPFFSTISGLLIGWGLFRYRFLDLAPVAQRAILESMHQGVIVLDSRGRILEINPTAKDLFGLANSDPIGQQQVLNPLLEQAEKADSHEIQLGAEKSKRWVTVSSTPLSDGRGRPVGALIVSHDTTKAHLLEQLREDLRQMLVHDLRNPLTIIHTGLNLLADTPNLSSHDQRILEMSRSTSSRAIMLVNAILDVSNLEQAQLPLELMSVWLNDIVKEVVESIAPLAQIQSVTIQSIVPDTLPPAWADEQLVVRIIQNLVDNAIKFSPKGGAVRIEASENGENLTISISDNGPGVPPELASRVFKKFATGDNRRRGSGLGLAFCRLAVKAHGGEIWVQSSAEPGATFSFTLPVHCGQEFEEE